jgi:hypothetical protein
MWQMGCSALLLVVAAAAAVVALGAPLRHPGLACVCLTAKFLPELGDSELEVLRLAHAK